LTDEPPDDRREEPNSDIKELEREFPDESLECMRMMGINRSLDVTGTAAALTN
jgi:hypothetical protein